MNFRERFQAHPLDVLRRIRTFEPFQGRNNNLSQDFSARRKQITPNVGFWDFCGPEMFSKLFYFDEVFDVQFFAGHGG